MKTWLLSSVVLLVLAGGCAARKPLVDMKGVGQPDSLRRARDASQPPA